MRSRFFYGWWLLVSSMIVIACSGFAIFGLPAYFPVLTATFGWSRAAIALGFSIILWGDGGTKLLYGALIDRKGARMALIFGTVIVSCAYISLGFTRSILYYYAICVLFGFGYAGMAYVPNSALVTRWFVRRRGLAIGLVTAASAFGGAIGPPVITYLIEKLGWSLAFISCGVVILLLPLALLLLVVREKPEDKGIFADGMETPADRSGAFDQKGIAPQGSFFSLLATGSTWLTLIPIFIAGIVIGSISVHLILYLREAGMEPYLAASIASLELILSVVGRLAFGYLSDRFSLGRISLVCFFLLVLASVLVFFVSTPGVVYLFAITQGLGHGGIVSFIPIVFAASFPARHIGKNIAAGLTVYVLGVSSGSLLLGFVFDQTGGYGYGFMLNAFLVLVATIIIANLSPARTRSAVLKKV